MRVLSRRSRLLTGVNKMELTHETNQQDNSAHGSIKYREQKTISCMIQYKVRPFPGSVNKIGYQRRGLRDEHDYLCCCLLVVRFRPRLAHVLG